MISSLIVCTRQDLEIVRTKLEKIKKSQEISTEKVKQFQLTHQKKKGENRLPLSKQKFLKETVGFLFSNN